VTDTQTHTDVRPGVDTDPDGAGAPGRQRFSESRAVRVGAAAADTRSRARTSWPERVGPQPPRRLAVPAPARTARRRLTDRLPAGWPLWALLVPFPLWWALGLTTFIFTLVAVPMLIELVRRKDVRYPPFFWIWGVFLFWQVLSLAMFNASPPGTARSATGGRLLSIGLNMVEVAGITVTLLYVCNLSVARVSQRTIAQWMGWFFLTVLAGGFLGLAAPHFQFRSALELALPRHLAANPFMSSLIHPIAAQVQNVLGDGSGNGRPAAPFGYTNLWGNAVSILLLWFVVGWVLPARSWRRWLGLAVALSAFVPIVLSLNRGLWIGVIVSVLWLGGRKLAHGQIGLVLTGSVVLAMLTAVLFVSPAGSVIQQRLTHGQSNAIRTFVGHLSIVALEHSPVVGYGGTRHAIGSSSSIAIGKSAGCPDCGNVATGSTGTLWSIMFNQGLGGIFGYFGFFLVCLWQYRRERTSIDEVALATVALIFVYMLFYTSIPIAPTLTMIAVGVLYRSQQARLRERTEVTVARHAEPREPRANRPAGTRATSNRATSNRLAGNRLVGNRLAGNRLAGNRLAGIRSTRRIAPAHAATTGASRRVGVRT
jgi:hypothetical protein